MPTSRYDNAFGGNAAKAKRVMKSQYGAEKGERVFYATANKKKKLKKRGRSTTARAQGEALKPKGM